MYLNHVNLENYWIIDIETDPIPATKIHCIVVINGETDEIHTWDQSNLGDFIVWYNDHSDCILVGHNAISFDIPTLRRLLGFEHPFDRIVDTLVLSYLYDPRMPNPDGCKKGPHSLEAWGIRLRHNKIDFKEFDKYSEDMLEYCKNDVLLTKTLFLRLTERMRKRGFSELSCEIEHQIRVVVDEQERNGWYFDIEGARRLYDELKNKQESLERDIKRLFPATLTEQGSYTYRTKRDGGQTSVYLRHCSTYPKIEWSEDGLTYTTFDYEEFNINSPKQRVERLLSLGWIPEKFTEKGNPQIDEESLLDFYEKSKIPEVKAIADYLVLQGRTTMILGWINNCRDDSRIHGRVFTCGAATRRMTHSNPNSANIPKAKEKVPYGVQCRSLWTVPNRLRCLVGYDAAGLEMRCFAHYLNNEEAFKLYTTGDPHQFNSDLLSIERDPVKNVFYAFIYGAANEKLGWTGNTSLVSEKEREKFGKWIRSKLIQYTPGLKELTDEIASEGEWLRTIDGGFVRCFSQHARINYKLQSAGAIAMKMTSIIASRNIKMKGLDALKVGDIHDEGQFDCAIGDADEVGKICIDALRQAGEELGFRVPLDGNYKIGRTWAETH